MTDGEQPVGGEAHLPHAPYWSTGTSGGACWCDNPPPRPRPAEPTDDGLAELEALREALRIHHPIMRSETGPFSGCRCGGVRLGQDVIEHVIGHLRRALDGDGG